MNQNFDHPTPLYHLIYIILRDKILRGIYSKGSKIPSENELAREYGVSRITARRSLENLSRDGLVDRHRGKGTIVVYDFKEHDIPAGGIEDLMENLVKITQETKVKNIDFSYVEADASLRNIFHFSESDSNVLQKSVRVRFQGATPFSYVIAHVPEEIGRSYTQKDLAQNPLLAMIEKTGVKISKAKQTITAVAADSHLSGVLKVKMGTPLLEVTRTVYDVDEAPVQHVKIFYRNDMYELNMQLSRVSGEKDDFWQSLS